MGKKAFLGLFFTLFSLTFPATTLAQSPGPSNDFSFNVGSANVGDIVSISVTVNSPNPGSTWIRVSCGNADFGEFTMTSVVAKLNTGGCAAGRLDVQVCSRAVDDPNWTMPYCTSKGIDLIAVPLAIPAPDANLWADVSSLIQGQCSAIHWNTSNAHTIVVEGQNVGVSGDLQVCPAVTKTYTLNAYGDGGEARREVQIIVNQAQSSFVHHNGDLIEIDGNAFIICNNTAKCHVPNPETLDALGLTWNMVNSRGLNRDQLLAIPQGPDVPDVTRDPNGFRDFKNQYLPNTTPIVHPAPDSRENDPIFPFANGDLIVLNDGRVFVICNFSQRCWVPNPATLDALGVTRDRINNRGWSNDRLLGIPEGSNIPDVTVNQGGFQEFKQNYFPNTSSIVHSDSGSTDTGSTSNSNCPSLGTNLSVGQIAVVSDFDPNPLHVFEAVGSNEIFTIPVKEQLSIVSGPVCADGRLWWQIGYNGRVGWAVGTTRNNMYNLIPNGNPLPGPGGSNGQQTTQSQNQTTTNSNTSASACSGAKAPQLSVGSQGTVPAGGEADYVSLRNEPQGGTIGQINQGQTFTVISGPICTDAKEGHLNWYQVRLPNGTIGWIPEGYDHSSYWIEPVGSTSSGEGSAPGASVSNTASTIAEESKDFVDTAVESLEALDFTLSTGQPVTGEPITDAAIGQTVSMLLAGSHTYQGVKAEDDAKIAKGTLEVSSSALVTIGLFGVAATGSIFTATTAMGLIGVGLLALSQRL